MSTRQIWMRFVMIENKWSEEELKEAGIDKSEVDYSHLDEGFASPSKIKLEKEF